MDISIKRLKVKLLNVTLNWYITSTKLKTSHFFLILELMHRQLHFNWIHFTFTVPFNEICGEFISIEVNIYHPSNFLDIFFRIAPNITDLLLINQNSVL